MRNQEKTTQKHTQKFHHMLETFYFECSMLRLFLESQLKKKYINLYLWLPV